MMEVGHIQRRCSGCGRLIPSDSKICPYCGKRFTSTETPIMDEGKKDKTALIIVLAIVILLIVPIAISATVYVYVNQMVGPDFDASKTVAASYYGKNETTYYVTYKITHADPGIYWSGITARWNGGSSNQIKNIDNTAVMTDTVQIGDYFSINVNEPGTYSIDLTYIDSILWTCPTITLN